ncbi:ArsR family transcriptional regulator [Campylobacter sp. FMV-PI01]|uniref:ArsR family transcriptional regulator n=1 Tax=Campylobacter portucalensis TaxID=2608384 RepID=A0A6L5WKQ9_9BACT|nr:replication/maintenance protein RepL [Campylobacter portucalensis]MSN96585.1 ArsR family transcriptional regulator [Campylobacter portucalensis]
MKDEIFKAIIGEKKFEILEFLLKNQDKNGFVTLSILEISSATKISRPTIIATLKFLESKKILKKLKNGVYKFLVFK